jgi:PcfJ-like protein
LSTVIDDGGDEQLVRSLLGTRIGTTFEDEEFWNTVIRFFIAHPELKPSHYGPIIDYLRSQKFVPSVPNPFPGQPGQPPEIPPQPHLCMKGRTPESLQRAIARWHRNLAEGQEAVRADGDRSPSSCWGPSGISPFFHAEEVGDDRREFEATELLGKTDLSEEGKAMGHCVATYSQLCASGRSSIWSLRMRIPSGRMVRLATVEVRTKDNVIVQVRKRANKPPTFRELSLLSQWSDQGGPKLASWLAP